GRRRPGRGYPGGGAARGAGGAVPGPGRPAAARAHRAAEGPDRRHHPLRGRRVSTRTDEQVLADLSEVMRRTFPDRECSGEVGPQTRLFADLGLASIDAVVLAERIEQYYGRRLPFGPFLAGLRARGADDLALGDLVAFLQRMTNDPPMTHQ